MIRICSLLHWSNATTKFAVFGNGVVRCGNDRRDSEYRFTHCHLHYYYSYFYYYSYYFVILLLFVTIKTLDRSLYLIYRFRLEAFLIISLIDDHFMQLVFDWNWID